MSRIPAIISPDDSTGCTDQVAPSVGASQRLVVAVAPRAQLAVMRSVLRAVGLTVRDQSSSGLEEVQLIPLEEIESEVPPKWLRARSEVHILLMMPLPLVAVARQLAAGVPPEQALQMWSESVESILRIIRPNRRRVSLFFAEAVLAEPKDFAAILSRRLRFPLQPVEVAGAPELPDAMLRMMAENAIKSSSRASAAAAEIEATALPIAVGQAGLLPVIDEVYSEYCLSREALTREIKEKESLLSELRRSQEALKTAELQDHMVEELRRQASRYGELEEENALLLRQLHEVKEELQSHYLQFRSQNSEASASQLAAAHATMLAIYNSYSWRMTRPLRWIHYVLTGARRPSSDRASLPDTLEGATQTIESLYNSKSWKITKPFRVLLTFLPRRPPTANQQ